jgi:hypothetical protein
MQPRVDRPRRDAKDLGDFWSRKSDVMREDEDRTMLDGQVPERALELVAFDDRSEIIARA